MAQPLVSVVMPVYNALPCLSQSLDDVLAQEWRDLELLCVDDGSTDATPDVLAGYAARDSRVRIIRQPNAGPGPARNTGLAAASGKYVLFLDADDRFEPQLISRLAQQAEETGADVTLCRADQFDHATLRTLDSGWMVRTELLPGAVFSPGNVAGHLFQLTHGWTWNKLFRRDFLRRTDLAFPPLFNSEDLVFTFQALASASRIAWVDQVLVHYRVNRPASVSGTRERDPAEPYRGFCLLRQGLEQRGLYQTYERSFLAWAMNFLVWIVASMGPGPAQRHYFRVLKKEWLPQMAFDAHSPGYYGSAAVYGKYLLAKYAPWPVFSAVLKLHRATRDL